MDMQPFKRFLDLTAEKRSLKEQIKSLDAELTPLTMNLPDIMIEEEMASFNLQGKNLHMRTTTYAKASEGNEKALADALRENGFESMLKPNSTSLKALVKEYLEQDSELPEWLGSLVDLTPTTKLASRKAQ